MAASSSASVAPVSASDIDATINELAESRAEEIIKEGIAFDYMYGVWQKRHSGDSAIGKKLILSIGNGSISNAKGFHQQINGEGGIGKTDAAQKAARIIDPRYVLNSALTPQVLYYPTECFIDGSIVFVDDITWNSELGVSIKRITSEFQDGAERTVTTEGVGVRQRSNKRLTFWVTSVDSQADEQLRDRFFRDDIDESPGHLKEVIETLEKQDSGETTNPTDSLLETKICHALTRDLRKLLIDVIIPYATRIEFKGDLRAYRMFIDMIRCFAIFAHAKRSIDSSGRLIATTDDFENARKLYEESGGHSRDKFTSAETDVLNAIIQCDNHTATKADIQDFTGLSSGRVGDILNGRGKGDQQKYGLLYKCPALVVDYTKKPYTYKLPAGFKAEGPCQVILRDQTR